MTSELQIPVNQNSGFDAFLDTIPKGLSERAYLRAIWDRSEDVCMELQRERISCTRAVAYERMENAEGAEAERLKSFVQGMDAAYACVADRGKLQIELFCEPFSPESTIDFHLRYGPFRPWRAEDRE